MQNKVIWLTGASSGIGEALAYQLGKKQAKLIISGRQASLLENVRNNCPPEVCADINILPFDLSENEQLPQATKQALGFYGHIDVMICNAGVSQRSLAMHTTLTVDRQLMEVNYFSYVSLAKHLLPSMVSRGGGHFVVVSSIVGKLSSKFRSGYAASKHALHGFFDALREEHHQDGIWVTLVCPGFIKTKISLNALTGDGTLLQQMDPAQKNGMEPDLCARKIISAIRNRKRKAYIGGKERHTVALRRYFPSLFNYLLRKANLR